jgi:hypothetical protein
MARDDRGPSHEPGRTAHGGDPAAARTPPARPDERGTGKERAERIGSGAGGRTPSGRERSRGTAAEAPEEIDPKGGVGESGGGL